MQSAGSGIFESVSDEEAFRAIHILAKLEGLSVEPAAAVAFAGLIKAIRQGRIRPTDTVVVNCTGHTMPVENMVLGDGWSKELELSSSTLDNIPEEGLFSALNDITRDNYARVAIVDDTTDARRLIRRILQTQGAFTIYEASNGRDAILLAHQEHPDLIILDLMMPEIDGFGVLDALKADPRTEDIPVIVVTAKELTAAEKDRLRGQIHTLMQKGEFLNDDLIEEIHSIIN